MRNPANEYHYNPDTSRNHQGKKLIFDARQGWIFTDPIRSTVKSTQKSFLTKVFKGKAE